MTEQQIFENSLNSLELTRPKDRDHLIPPIIPLEREETEISGHAFPPAAPSDLFQESPETSNNAPQFDNNLNNSAFQTVTPSAGAITSTYPIISSMGSYAPPPINTMTPCVPFVASQGSWHMPPNSVAALPSSATVPPFATVIDSPQLHAALMGCMPAQNFPEPYGNIMHNQQGLPTPNQQANFIPFPPLPMGVPSNIGGNAHSSPGPFHQQQHIEISEIRNAKDQDSVDRDESDNSNRQVHGINKQVTVLYSSSAPLQETPTIVPPTAPPLAEDRDAVVTSTSALSSPERRLTSPTCTSDLNGGFREGSLETPDLSRVTTSENGDEDNQHDDSQNQGPPQGKKNSTRPGKRQAATASEKDSRYYDKRRRNNQSAKRSRDARKEREESVSRRADFLERENSILKAQLATLKEEANSLRQLISQRPVVTNMIATNQL